MKQLLFILALLIGTCFATHAKTIKLVPSALDSTRMDTVVISDLQDVDEDQNAAMHNISSDFGDWNSGPPTSVAIVALIICCGLPFFIVAIVLTRTNKPNTNWLQRLWQQDEPFRPNCSMTPKNKEML